MWLAGEFFVFSVSSSSVFVFNIVNATLPAF